MYDDFSIMCHVSDSDTFNHVCSPTKRAGLRRQGRVELSPDQQTDPWVKLADSPEKLKHHCKTMSDHNGNNEINGTASETTDTISYSKPEETPDAKKGPPVAPKPAWVRQSLRSIKSGKSPAEAFKHPDSRSQDTGRTFGVSLRATSSAANLSIKQKISSFETFSNADGAEKTSRRLAPSSSLPLVEKSQARVERPQPVDTNSVGKSRTAVINTQESDKPSRPDTSEPSPTTTPSSEPEQVIFEKSDTCEKPTESTNVPEEAVEEEEKASPSQEDLPSTGHFPRRSSSSKDPPSEKSSSSEGLGSHPASLRTRSLPLNTSSTDAHSQSGLEGDFLEIILSFSNQVSHALMRSMQSLPQSPCLKLGNPWSASQGSPHSNPAEEEVSAQDSSEKGFSVRYALLLSTARKAHVEPICLWDKFKEQLCSVWCLVGLTKYSVSTSILCAGGIWFFDVKLEEEMRLGRVIQADLS